MPQLNAALPIVSPNGTMQPAFRDQMNRVNNALPIIGEGSPEGVVEALQYSMYFDSLGVSGSIVYVKMQPEIAGDRSAGWVAI
jgi:hypothetical protein